MVLNLFFLIIFSLIFLGLGRRLLSLFLKKDKLAWPEEFFFSLGLGIGAVETLGLVLGFLGLLQPILFWGLFLFLFFLSFQPALRILKKVSLSWPKAKIGKLVVGLIAFRLLLNFLAAQAPATEGDSLWYHLTLPKIFIRHGRIFDVKLLASYLPFQTEMLYLWAMIIKDEILAQGLNWLVGGVFLTLAVFFFCCRFFSEKIALLSSLIFIFIPLVSWESVTPKVDLFWTFFVLLAFWSLLVWQKNKEKGWLNLGAVFLGLNLATKGVLGFLPFFGLLPLFLKNMRGNQKKLLRAGFLAFLFFAPYLLRNLYLTANPVYPLLPEIFGGGGLDPQALAYMHQQFFEKLSLSGFFNFLWKVSAFPQKYGPEIGPLFLLFIPLGLIIFWRQKKAWRPEKLKSVRLVVAFCFLFYSLWYFASVHTIRYLLPLFPFLAIFVTATIVYLIKLNWATKLITISIFSLSVVMSFLTFFWTFEPYGPKIKTALGIYKRKEYLLKMLPYNEDFFWINDNLPQEAKILLYLNEWQRTFYLDRDFVVAGLFQREVDFTHTERWSTFQDFLEELKENKITHIYTPEDLHLQTGVEKIHQGKFGSVNEIIF